MSIKTHALGVVELEDMWMDMVIANNAMSYANLAMVLVSANVYIGAGKILKIQIENVKTVTARNVLHLMKEINNFVKAVKMDIISLRANVQHYAHQILIPQHLITNAKNVKPRVLIVHQQDAPVVSTHCMNIVNFVMQYAQQVLTKQIITLCNA